jgi:hypothetical protein
MTSTNEETGRAAAIAPQKLSFDLGDDSEGAGVGKVLTDPEYLRRLGYIADETKEEATEEAPKAETEQVKEEVAQAEVVPVAAQPKVEESVVPQQATESLVAEPAVASQPAVAQAPILEQFTAELKSEVPVAEAPKIDQAIAVN